MSRKQNVTIRDVAAAAGVSVSTVSRVLNDKDDVAATTYDRVRRTIERLGYASNLAARTLRSQQTDVIGLVALDLNDPFVVEVLKGINEAIQDLGYDLILYASGRKAESAPATAAWEQRHVSLLNGGIADGVIIITPSAATFPTAYPLVAIDPHSQNSDFYAVIATNRTGAMEAMAYLISLGHRRIGFIGGRRGLLSAAQRLEGYQAGLQQAGLPLDPTLVQAGDYSRGTGFSRAQTLLNLPNPPTAIFAANDASAIGTIEAAREAGLRIPQDLSVAGFDNIPKAAFITPPLTTVEQPIGEIGYTATRMLVELIQGEMPASRLHEVPTRLIIRESCRAI